MAAKSVAFNSLFEMHVAEKIYQDYKTTAFNSLFEMRQKSKNAAW